METEPEAPEVSDDVKEGLRSIRALSNNEPILESPIDINIAKTVDIELPPLAWNNLDLPPKKMKVTNSGYTLILSGKWYQERPYISDGPLMGDYVFSQLHFHWGRNDGEGSEHTMDGVKHPLEMHAVFFKANYLTHEAALKEKDGIVIAAFIYKLQSGKNAAFQILVENIMRIQKAHSFHKMDPLPVSCFVRRFERDYFVYWGSICTSACLHQVLWMVSREPVGVSAEQVDELRSMLDENDEPLQGNFRQVKSLDDRTVFHVCPSGSKYATLLALP